MNPLAPRFFNTTGSCFPERHYLGAAAQTPARGGAVLIDQGQYFVIHAPRQSGKTTYAFLISLYRINNCFSPLATYYKSAK